MERNDAIKMLNTAFQYKDKAKLLDVFKQEEGHLSQEDTDLQWYYNNTADKIFGSLIPGCIVVKTHEYAGITIEQAGQRTLLLQEDILKLATN